MTHRQAVGLMVLVTLLWSIAGVVTRHLDSARSFEVTFWRSFFTALSLAVGLLAWRGRGLWTSLRDGGRWLWLSGLCWAVMFTAFMLALTLTSVAYVLVTMALGPVITALFSRIFLRFTLPWSTWLAIVVAGLGVAVMFGGESGDGFAPAGVLVACCVPLAGAANWTVLQRVRQQREVDMLPAVLIGAIVSALFTLPLAWPPTVTAADTDTPWRSGATWGTRTLPSRSLKTISTTSWLSAMRAAKTWSIPVRSSIPMPYPSARAIEWASDSAMTSPRTALSRSRSEYTSLAVKVAR